MLLQKIIVSIVLVSSLLGFPTKGTTIELEIVPPTYEQEVQRIFKDKANIALAVFKHESSGSETSKNWNCFYYKKVNDKQVRYSTFCKKIDREKAWSVDCGYFQINVKGKVCPLEYMTRVGSLERVEKIYKQQGLNAWVSYKNKKYLQFM